MKRPGKFILAIIFLSFILLWCFLCSTAFTMSIRNTGYFDYTKKYYYNRCWRYHVGTSFPSVRFLPPHDNPFLLLESVADTLSLSDITFGNLEGSFLNEGEAAKKCKDTTLCYLFRMPERYVSALTATGFDILSLANNHFGDFGLPARNRTKEILDSVGIKYAGLIEHPWSIFRKD